MNSAQKQQIEFLKQAGSPLGLGMLLLLVIGLGIGSWVTQNEIVMMFFIFFVVVMLGSISTFKHLRYAIRALKEGKIVKNQAVISIEVPYDNDRYYVTVQDRHQLWWKFEFRPQNWTPQVGEITVDVYFLQGIAYPVLVVGADGILVPYDQPKRVSMNKH
jgi:hypothetical protein